MCLFNPRMSKLGCKRGYKIVRSISNSSGKSYLPLYPYKDENGGRWEPSRGSYITADVYKMGVLCTPKSHNSIEINYSGMERKYDHDPAFFVYELLCDAMVEYDKLKDSYLSERYMFSVIECYCMGVTLIDDVQFICKMMIPTGVYDESALNFI